MEVLYTSVFYFSWEGKPSRERGTFQLKHASMPAQGNLQHCIENVLTEINLSTRSFKPLMRQNAQRDKWQAYEGSVHPKKSVHQARMAFRAMRISSRWKRALASSSLGLLPLDDVCLSRRHPIKLILLRHPQSVILIQIISFLSSTCSRQTPEVFD